MAAEERTMPCRKVLSTLGFGWMQTQGGQFERYFIRACSDCKKMHIDKLSWVDTDYVWCLSCFSQNVQVDNTMPVQYKCNDCGYMTEFELEPDEADFD